MTGRCRNEADPCKCQDQHEAKSCRGEHHERGNQTTAPVGRHEARNAAEDQPKQDHTPRNRSNLGTNLNQAKCGSRIGDLREFGCCRPTDRLGQLGVDPVERLLNHLWRTLDLEDQRGSVGIDEHLLEAHECLREDVLERGLGNDCHRSRLDQRSGNRSLRNPLNDGRCQLCRNRVLHIWFADDSRHPTRKHVRVVERALEIHAHNTERHQQPANEQQGNDACLAPPTRFGPLTHTRDGSTRRVHRCILSSA